MEGAEERQAGLRRDVHAERVFFLDNVNRNCEMQFTSYGRYARR